MSNGDTTQVRAFDIVIQHTDDGTEVIDKFFGATLAEALLTAERTFAGVRDSVYGITPKDYDLARAEGIQFNEADGLLV